MIPDAYIQKLSELLSVIEDRISGDANGQSRSPDDWKWFDLHDDEGCLKQILMDFAGRMANHYPFHQPWYAGQMLKPPHPAAWLAYSAAMAINPNNHALDGGPEASYMEKEVIGQFLTFVGFPADGLGHLTSSGTIANLEALWIARELHPDKPVAVSSQAHYTHNRMGQVLRHPVNVLPDGDDGCPDPALLKPGDQLPGTIVVTLGTTGLGNVEPLHRILPWARENGVRIHVDAAYGGFFHAIRSSGLIESAAWDVLPEVDSIVIDPHKHGLQPYGCGCVLFRDPGIGRLYRHDSPYTYFTSEELHLGEISLECSRAGAAAAALWFTLNLFPLGPFPGGSHSLKERRKNRVQGDCLADILVACRRAAMRFHGELAASPLLHPVTIPELDIVAFVPMTNEKSYSSVSRKSTELLQRGMTAHDSRDKVYLSTLELNPGQANRYLPEWKRDQESVRVLRSVLMKPEHYDFIPELIRRIEHHCAAAR